MRAGPGRRGLRAGLAAATALTLVVTAWNDNRIAWIALAAMTVLALALSRDQLRGRRSRGALALAAAALAVFAALFAWSLQQRTERLEGTPYAAEAQIARDPRPAHLGLRGHGAMARRRGPASATAAASSTCSSAWA